MSDSTHGTGELLWLLPEHDIRTKRARAEARNRVVWNDAVKLMNDQLGGGPGWRERVAQGEWAMDNWIVEGVFRESEVAMLAAEAGTSKSFLALDLLIAMVSGGKWLGQFECMTGPVIFWSGEQEDYLLDNRLVGLLTGRSTSLADFSRRQGDRFLLKRPVRDAARVLPTLSDPSWWSTLKTTLERIPQESRPRLWIFDPLMALMTSTTKEEEVSPLLDRCRWLAEFCRATVLLVHHFKKQQAGGGNGHSDRIHGPAMFRNLVDNVLVVEKDSDCWNLLHVYGNKVKSGKDSPDKPLFHVFRRFDPMSYTDLMQAVRDLGGEPKGLESPGALKSIVLRHVAYNASWDPKNRTDDGAELEITPDGPAEAAVRADVVPIRQEWTPKRYDAPEETVLRALTEPEPGAPSEPTPEPVETDADDTPQTEDARIPANDPTEEREPQFACPDIPQQLDTKPWDEGHHLVYAVLLKADAPLSQTAIYLQLKSIANSSGVRNPMGANKVRTRLGELVSWGAVLKSQFCGRDHYRITLR